MDTTPALLLFVLVGLFSPGPNVILLTLSGARFGFRRTLPHLLGVVIGVGAIAAATALGVGAALEAAPILATGLKALAGGWILWLAWRLLTAARAPARAGAGRPFRFHEAVLFQWVNPKLWAVTLAAAAGFPGDLPPMQEALRLALVFSGTNLFVCLFWSWAGSLLTRLLAEERHWRAFTAFMAGALALSAGMMLL